MRRIATVLGTIAALLVLVLLSLPFLISANQFKPTLESELSTALGRPVTIGELKLSILAGGLSADGLSIADDPAFGSTHFLQAKSLKVAVDLWPLIVSRKLNVRGLIIDQPEVALLQSPSGNWNYSSLGGRSGQAHPPAQDRSGRGLDLSAKLVRIVDGRFTMGKSGGRRKPLALDKLNVEVRDFSASGSFPFSLTAKVVGGGDIQLGGKAGPLDATDVELTPLTLTLDIARLDLAAALAGTAPDVAGTASLRASGNSGGGQIALNGKLRAEGLKLAKNGTPASRQVEFDFAAQHDLRKHAGSLQRGAIHIGAATASLTGTYAERGDTIVIDAKFMGTKMPVTELAEWLPPLGIELPSGSKLQGGTATAACTVEGPADHLVTEGAISLDNTRLANFDLGAKMRLIQALAGIKSDPNTDIETLRGKVKYTRDGSDLNELLLVLPGIGEVSGAGTISPANALDFQMSATVQSTRAAILSRTAVPFFVQGTAMNPVFKPDVGSLAKTEAKTMLQSQVQKRLEGSAGKAASGILDNLFRVKKK